MKALLPVVVVLAIASLGAVGPGCSTTTPIAVDPTKIAFSVEKAATLARASHAVSCEAVVTAHAAGVLKGQPFNTAKAACVTADNLLDAADASLAKNDQIGAAKDVQDALKAIDDAKALTPKAS